MEKLLHEQSSVVIYGPHEIFSIGPGEETIAGIMPNGMHAALKRKRAFHMACDHYITLLEELGGSCAWCSMIARLRGTPRLDTAGLICKACETRCSFQYCGAILCKTHAAGLADPADPALLPAFCPIHVEELTEQAALAESVEKFGRLPVTVSRYIKNVIGGEPPCLP